MFNFFDPWCQPHCCQHDCRDIQKPPFRNHVHEFTGSTRFNENGPLHNHRFAGVSGPAISTGNSHVHLIVTNTDNTNHFHQINVHTGPAINVGNGRHVHFTNATTSFVLEHNHRFINATLIEQPN